MRPLKQARGRAMRAICWGVVWALSIGAAWAAPAAPVAQSIRIEGYTDEAMEPFLSRDGKFLFFNTRNDPGVNTDILFAERVGDDFVFRSVLPGTVSYELDGTPTMSADKRFCFVSPRDYRRTLVTVYCGAFDGKRVNSAEPQKALPAEGQGRLIFDIELFADGKSLIFAEGAFDGEDVPEGADLYLATLGPRGFTRSNESKKLFANVNTGNLEFAPAISSDGLVLYFTRARTGGMWPFGREPKIYRASRNSLDEPFSKPMRMESLDGFVEAPTVADDGALYFHKRVKERYELWRTSK